ncbi:MAG TPA: Mpo1-like protein [Burkholderiales bacterium]|nr:Mpo1-like protein [Burkholderiales bacterium]
MGFSELYPRYQAEHPNRTCRRLHFVGTPLGPAAALHAFAGHF